MWQTLTAMRAHYPLNTFLTIVIIWLCAFSSILCDITINEISCGNETKAFIELRSSADHVASNNSFMLNVYNGNSEIVSSNTFNLTEGSYQLILMATESFKPDASIFVANETWLPCDSDFVVLYQLAAEKTMPGNSDIIDAIVYNGSSKMNNSTDLAIYLLSSRDIVTLPVNGSLSCCGKTFSTLIDTPGEANGCPAPAIIINEINADNPGDDYTEYIELFDGGGGNTTLDGLLVVFYNGNGNLAIYDPLSLNGYQTNSDGYFVIGQDTVDNVDLVITKTSHWIQNGPDAIVLHYGKEADFPKDVMASNKSVVDVVVYGTNDRPAVVLLTIFTPGQMQVNENYYHNTTGDEAILRCFSNDVSSLASFIVGHDLSPGKHNICPLPPLVINEVYLDDKNATNQFIEISSAGVSMFPLRKLVVVLYKSDDTSAAAVAIDKIPTDVTGFYVVTSIPQVTVADVKSILLYIGSADAYAQGSLLNNTKTPVHSLLDVDQYFAPDMSVSQCVNGTETFLKTTTPTRGKSNACFAITTNTISPITTPGTSVVVTSKVYINELNADTPSIDTHEFIELKGPPNTSLNGTVLVFYNGATNKVYKHIPLDGHVTNAAGFFLIGGAAVSGTDITLNDNFVQNGPDAVVYYQLPDNRFKGSLLTPITEGVIDFIIYSKNTPVAQTLLDLFAPGQTQILEAGNYINSDHSISRCPPESAVKDLSAFILATPTPGAENNCTMPTVYVNEVNVGINESFFVELHAPANSSFDGLVLVFYIESAGAITSYPISLRNKFSLAGGYFMIGGSGTNAVESETEIRYTSKSIENALREPVTAIAIALFKGVFSLFEDPQVPPNARLVDFIILGDSSTLLTNLNVSQTVVPLTAELKSGNSSVSWCDNCGSAGSLLVDMPTPREINDCDACNASTLQPSTEAASTNPTSTTPNTVPTAPPMQGIILNEIVVSDDISEEFIELKGDYNTTLDDYTLVFYKSSDKTSIWDLPLTGYKTDSNGLFVLNTIKLKATSTAVTKGFLELGNETMAIVLYWGNPGPFIVDTTDSTSVKDFIVYNTMEKVVSGYKLPELLFPNGNVIPILVSSGESVSRCLGLSSKDYTAFVISKRTPGLANDCRLPKLFINEISPTENATYDFIELRAEEATALSLTSLFLRVFNGTDGTISHTVNLMNKKTNPQGLFWLSTVNTGSPDLVIDVHPPDIHFPMPSGGVALYQGNPIAADSSLETLIDAVLYGQPTIPKLVPKLPPNQEQITLTNDAKYGRQSISRCSWCTWKMQASFLLTSRTPGKSNDCTSVKTLPKLVINELSTTSTQFIEFKGDSNSDVSDYKVILFGSDTTAYKTFALSCTKTDDKGFFLIAPNSNPNAKIELNIDLRSDLAAVALYDGRIRLDSALSDIGIVDALVYGSSYKDTMLIDVLTPNSTMFVLDANVFKSTQYAISRCKNDYKRNSTMYMVSKPTPAEANACNFNATFNTMIQLKLDTADCNIFKEDSYKSMASILDAVVRGVNNYCKCGLTRLYFIDPKFHCGSVIFEATMISSSQEHMNLMFTSYQKYIHGSPKLTVNNKVYEVNSSCYDDCYVAVKPTGATKTNSQVTVTIAVIVTVLVVFGLIVVFVVIYIKKKRKGILHFRLARFDNNDEDFVDFDEPTGSENASFSNPLYAKIN